MCVCVGGGAVVFQMHLRNQDSLSPIFNLKWQDWVVSTPF